MNSIRSGGWRVGAEVERFVQCVCLLVYGNAVCILFSIPALRFYPRRAVFTVKVFPGRCMCHSKYLYVVVVVVVLVVMVVVVVVLMVMVVVVVVFLIVYMVIVCCVVCCVFVVCCVCVCVCLLCVCVCCVCMCYTGYGGGICHMSVKCSIYNCKIEHDVN